MISPSAQVSGRQTCRPGDAPNLFGVSRVTIYRWAKAGHIHLHKKGNMTFLDVQEVKNFILAPGGPSGGPDPKG